MPIVPFTFHHTECSLFPQILWHFTVIQRLFPCLKFLSCYFWQPLAMTFKTTSLWVTLSPLTITRISMYNLSHSVMMACLLLLDFDALRAGNCCLFILGSKLSILQSSPQRSLIRNHYEAVSTEISTYHPPMAESCLSGEWNALGYFFCMWMFESVSMVPNKYLRNKDTMKSTEIPTPSALFYFLHPSGV